VNLHEFQAKRLFAKYGVPIPQGDVAYTPAEARAIAEKLGGKGVVVKAQVHIGGRGKAGGVKLAKSPAEAEAHAAAILGMDIKGLTVKKVLVDELAPGIEQELYLAVLVDRSARRNMVMASAAGGMDIEEVAATTPEKIVKVHIDPTEGITEAISNEVADSLGLPAGPYAEFHGILSSLYDCFLNSDASLTEINPLIVTGEGHLMAVDGKMSIDDNGLFRQPEIAEMRDDDDETPAEMQARLNGLTYIQLDGEIGCMVNGAGLAMATMDIIKLFGGEPANFLDIGGGASEEGVTAALKLILSDTRVKAVLINIFGGIVRGDEVARGIVGALKQIDTDVPMVVRLLGTNAEEGRKILAESDMITAETLTEAARKVVAAARGEA
jgi:succinyl-CoA synthetase beta subunit